MDPVRSVEVSCNAVLPRRNDLVAACSLYFEPPAARVVLCLGFDFELCCVVAGCTEILDGEFRPIL
ncbi:hypothetical protein [Haloarcula sebkhae]|uniref:Uncharacterized protein n=1 Tax=Haloarcula sebkhae TaxID=932660 RepID=A0A830EXC8_9EURY|nr:hypothetical protein GCM10009067_40760 [Haloarcula sebkhae]